MFDLSLFRDTFPAFADLSVYPDARVSFQGSLADKLYGDDPWGDLQGYVAMLAVAHALSMQGKSGGSSGGVKGVVSAKSVDRVSVSYDVSATTYKDAAYFNGSPYGVELYWLIQMAGAGPMHVMGNSTVLPWQF
ncbi:hypothetical protein UU9_12323 [Rhodanobacter fulvus Jip2]|uniref:Bacteriophage protein n=1 Tax=Rhodanobacter fulvus Jip2 TaxID=1163408 RepID=I4VMU3_9GAMM|nr:DUF4054 domain-containing protein [Rhodanobacter fulvus]EIL88534.1 hypothetical protein UU9_12323 [Rhodanobacter fulvus Jip2]